VILLNFIFLAIYCKKTEKFSAPKKNENYPKKLQMEPVFFLTTISVSVLKKHKLLKNFILPAF